MNSGYCRGDSPNLKIVELDSKVWHDDDLYEAKCNKCGLVEQQLARRPSGTIFRCLPHE